MNSTLKIPVECPCELSGPEECQACNDRKNASIIETQQELILKLFFENQMLKKELDAKKDVCTRA